VVTRRAPDTRPVVRRFTAVTGTGDAPGRSRRLLRPRWPRHLATATSPRQAGRLWNGSSSPTDPAPPCGSAWEKFYGPKPLRHKGFRRSSRCSGDFLNVLHRTAHSDPQVLPGSPQPNGSGVQQWPRPGRPLPTQRSADADRVLGNGRRALIGMSDKGPSSSDHRTGVRPSP
jgi:hypothetical protein